MEYLRCKLIKANYNDAEKFKCILPKLVFLKLVAQFSRKPSINLRFCTYTEHWLLFELELYRYL